jgi:nickel/cobalt transporter (NicO) family protein
MDFFSFAYLPVAVGLGALHALEPGHSKTMIAAYLIGTKGTKRDALLLGLAAATTHSVLVVGLAVAALSLGREAFTDQAMHWLQLGSGVIVILLGLWMLWRRWPRRHHEHHDHDHDLDDDDDAHARAHAAAMPAYVAAGSRPSPGQVIAFGAAGGMIPCPASVTVMLMALSVGKITWGVAAVACFSVGLAVTLVGIGMVVVVGASALNSTGRFAWLITRAPQISAALVIATGVLSLVFAH